MRLLAGRLERVVETGPGVENIILAGNSYKLADASIFTFVCHSPPHKRRLNVPVLLVGSFVINVKLFAYPFPAVCSNFSVF